jgi:Asp-tRNA(Asn)/Glu-tRNA(Gln) amidotransferase A subunit family amidase
MHSAHSASLDPLLVDPDAAYCAGATTPSAVLAAHLAVIDDREPQIQAFTALNREAAEMAAAASTRRWSEGKSLSPIDGMVVGIKDVIETADMPTGQGSPIWEGFHTRRDAASVQALREAGAIVLGKTTTTEFATRHTFAGTRNPHDLERTPGGSSSGSAAAVGGRMLDGALGTQVVGSILRPASYCGAVGYKPSFGALNRGGSNDQLSQSCLGTIATTLSGAWALATAIAARVGGDPGGPALRGSERLPAARSPGRIALLKTAGWSQIESSARLALDQELQGLKNAGVELLSDETDEDLAELEFALADAWQLTERILSWEFCWPLRSYPYEQLSPTLQKRLLVGKDMGVDDYDQALARRDAIRQRFRRLAERLDCFVTLAATGAAPRLNDSTGSPAMNVPASLLGVPAISLPILSDLGLPLGLQLIGKMGQDADLMALARWRVEMVRPAATTVED